VHPFLCVDLFFGLLTAAHLFLIIAATDVRNLQVTPCD